MNSSPPPDPFADFADEESAEFRQVRAAVPTNAEIDAFFSEEGGDGSDPRASGSPFPPTHESRLASIFGDQKASTLRNQIGHVARSSAETIRERLGAAVRPAWLEQPRFPDHFRSVTRGSVQAIRRWLDAASRLRSRSERARPTLLGGPVEFAGARKHDRPARAAAPGGNETAHQPAVESHGTRSTLSTSPVQMAEPPQDARRREPPQPATHAPRPQARPPARSRLPVKKGAAKRDARPATWTQVAVGTGVVFLVAFISVVWLAELASNGWRLTGPDPGRGSLTVTTQPAGARVIIDGAEQGVTPATVSVPPGEHILEVRTGEVSKTMPLSVAPGAELSRAFDLNTRTQPGRLEVRTRPAGAQVFVDGRHRGRSPLTLTDLNPGQHTILVQRSTQSAQEVVNVEAGAASAVTLSLAEATAATSGRSAGWLSIAAPIELEVFEGGRLLGTTRAGRLDLAAGRRELELVNDLFGVRVQRSVDVAAGHATPLAIDIPPGVVTINAIPWADVRLDGRLVGRTPLADVKIPAGRHDLVFRHPQHGQRRLTIMVAADRPLVVTTDLRK